MSCISGDLELAKLGANPNIYCYSKIEMKMPALLAACYYGRVDVIVLLVKHPRCDLTLTASSGKKAIEILGDNYSHYVSAFVRAEKERTEGR